LLRAAAAVLPKTGEDFLPAVVQEIAGALKAELVLVGEFVGTDKVRTVALWRGGRIVDNIEFSLHGTPAEQLAGRSVLCYPRHVRSEFPTDERLAEFGVDGYVAVPLVGTKDNNIGVIAAFTRKPITDESYAASVLQLFTSRVAAEMERALTERELRKSEAHLHAVQRVEAIGRLAGNIAHDFNNLLMIVVGYAEILKTRMGPGAELTQLLEAADRASTLTRQLLAFGRRQMMEVQRLDLNRVVAQVQAMLTRVIGAQVRLTTSLDPKLPHVEADPGQLEQVLVNLAINARDAMPDGGTLHITTSVEDVTEVYNQMPPGRYVCVSVSDTGTGMAPEVLRQIFEPYFTTKGSNGTGLGLSSVYGIIKQTGGFIWCDSELGKGTRFKIYLRPVAGAASNKPTADSPADAIAGGAETILVVDDERAVRELLTIILRGRGYTVIPATDARTALEVLGSPDQHIDLVVSDIVMHGMSGTRLVEEIQSRWPAMKLLFVSGYSQGVALNPESSARKVPLLGKPFTPVRLEAMVRNILDGAEVRRHPVVQPE
jgi:two-component system, cell cycle sensor histidine kinase and response regulator CckA